tara:strand:+ start:103 stop:702 length:600 start_codon:yes stop_codon:yes gene_type:complete
VQDLQSKVNKMADLFQAPIPGQSLTDEPKNAPWENPSEMSTVEEVVTHYIEKLNRDEVIDDLALIFELGGSLQEITETMMIMGTMNGLHTVDAQMLAGPMVGAYIKAIMSEQGIEVKETDIDENKIRTEKQKKRLDAIYVDAIQKSLKNGDDEGTEMLRQMQDANMDDEPMAEEPMLEEEIIEEPMVEQPAGLMARGMV